ncbi:MAG: 6-phosphogluconolactonase [Acidimicrobiia bacterium]|nr:6-phosphogluconolactonase [Acidimicrobiia bacterium]
MRIVVARDPADLAGQAAARIAGLIASSGRERVSLGLAGGSTPRGTYERLRDQADIDWTRVDAWLSDERWVPPDHEDSNGLTARTALLDHVSAAFFAIPWGEGRPPQAAAEEYAATLTRILGAAPDIVLLGMGDDGHTASLFPGTAALAETERDYVANLVPGRGWRLTATLPLLHRTRHLIFLVAGRDKASVLARVMDGEPLPSRLVAEGAEDVTWLVDEAAASALE